MLNVFCTLWGDKYDISYVDKLYSMVERNCDESFQFFCQTDKKGFRSEVITLPFLTEFPRSTPKEMEEEKAYKHGKARLWDRPKLNYWIPNGWGISGRKIAFDIDIIIQNNLQPILDLFENKPLTMRSWWHNMEHESWPDWRRRYGARNNGGFFMWTDEQVIEIYEDIRDNWNKIYFCFTGGSDNYLSTRHLDKFDFIPPDYTYSFNRGCEYPHDLKMWEERKEKIICVFNTDVGNNTHLELHEAAKAYEWIKTHWYY